MGQRSKITALPEDVRAELERRLVASSFSNYDALAEWLADKGFEVHRSSVYRYGSQFEQRVKAMQAATQQARTIVDATPDDEGAMNEALMRLTQEKMFSVLMDLEVDPETVDLAKLARAVADMSRSTVTLRRYQADVRAKVERAREELERAERAGGITAETRRTIDKTLLGIA